MTEKIDEFIIDDDLLLTEKTVVSFHVRTPTQMALLHKNALQKKGHAIVSHETTGNGSHVIHHLTPSNKLRVTTVGPIHDRKRYKAKIHNRPGTAEEYKTYGIKK